jgi:hypothetical protein
MTIKLHSTILATSLAATLAVGFASAAIIADRQPVVAPKGDRLPIVAMAAPATDYVTVETRHDGVSELKRIPLN